MMEFWYKLTDLMLPFEWLEHSFMKNALLAVLLLAPVFGLLGTMVVNNRMAFFSDALGHGAFTGIAIGSALGLIKPLWAAVIFSLVFSILITFVKNRTKASTDTIIGVFSSTAIAAGLVILSRGGKIPTAFLVGDLLSITAQETGLLLVLLVSVFVIWAFLLNSILVISINQSLARSRGLKTVVIESVFTCIIAIVVTISLQWVGILIINSMLVLPAAAARNITANTRRYHVVSVGIALISSVSGLILSYFWNTATGATIVLVSSLLFFITFIVRSKHV